MDSNSRMFKSFKNLFYGVIGQGITVILSFVTRTVFIKYLSVDYLGVNGLFVNILTILSLAELGVGGAMIQSMYKPLSKGENKKLSGLMTLYAKIYRIIGVIVAIIGISIIPFFDIIIKDQPSVDNLYVIYLLFLLNSVSSYFFAYKRSTLQADQKQYIISKYHLIFIILKSVFQIIIIVRYENYLLFLCIQIIVTLLENIFISSKVDKLYPFLKKFKKSELEELEKQKLWTNVKALMVYKLGSTVLDGTDNILISSFVGVASVGLLSNYTLIIAAVSMLLQEVTNSITGSIGNFVSKENLDRQEDIFEKISFLYFIFYGLSFVMLFMLLNPFIYLWIGEKYLLSSITVFFISFNWYITGIISPVWMFRSTKGLFIYGRYRPLISAVINLVVSIILANYIGLLGVLIGTTITRISTNVWYDPYVVYHYGFNKSANKYYLKQLKYIVVLLVLISLLTGIFAILPSRTLVALIVQILVTLLFSTILIWLIYFKSEEFQYFKQIIKK